MFASATLKLTGWYLLILTIISLIFSVLVYQLSISEVESQLGRYESGIRGGPYEIRNFNFKALYEDQLTQAHTNIIAGLIYTNIVILVAGGIGSYVLARRTLRPIEEAHEAQSRFVSDASHELRTPLAAMTTELEVALRDPKLSKGEMKELLTSNLEEVHKLTHLSDTLLKLSKGDFASLTQTTFCLGDAAKNVVERYDKTGARIHLTVGKTTTPIHAHRPSIEELIVILVDNALKYSPDDSLISVKVSRRGAKAHLSITNTGEGIRADDLPHIFDRFYRADNSRSGNSGHGLGLSLAKQIVELHRGELTASSAPNHATTFTFLLPIHRQSQAKNKD